MKPTVRSIAALAGVWLISGGSRQVVVNNDIVSSLPEPETAAPLAHVSRMNSIV